MSPFKKKKKQARLPLSAFVKNPSEKLMHKHDKLVNKDKPKPYSGKARVDKKMKQKLTEEKRVFQGAQRWLKYMNDRGTENIEQKRPDLLFQVFGEPPSRVDDPYDLNYTESDLDVSTSDEMFIIEGGQGKKSWAEEDSEEEDDTGFSGEEEAEEEEADVLFVGTKKANCATDTSKKNKVDSEAFDNGGDFGSLKHSSVARGKRIDNYVEYEDQMNNRPSSVVKKHHSVKNRNDGNDGSSPGNSTGTSENSWKDEEEDDNMECAKNGTSLACTKKKIHKNGGQTFDSDKLEDGKLDRKCLLDSFKGAMTTSNCMENGEMPLEKEGRNDHESVGSWELSDTNEEEEEDSSVDGRDEEDEEED